MKKSDRDVFYLNIESKLRAGIDFENRELLISAYEQLVDLMKKEGLIINHTVKELP